MKEFTRIEPTTIQQVGLKYKREAVVKNFKTEDGKIHEFTTFGNEGSRHGAVLAITRDKKVVTTYQFRAGPEIWMYELPGGGFYDHESEQQAAVRELKEETGYVSESVEFLGTVYRDAYSNDVGHYYLAIDCYMSDGGRSLDQEESAQGAEARLISIDECLKNAVSGRMTDAAAVLLAYDKLMKIKGDK